MKRVRGFIRSVVWTSALAVALIIAGVVAVMLGDIALGVVLSLGSVTFALLANKE
jgi:Zn-dependent membrane protease YugP